MIEAEAADWTRIREEAASWVVTLGESPADEALQQACAAWCARDGRHARLLDEMRRMWSAMTPQTPLPGRPRRASRAMLQLVVLVPLVAIAAAALPWRCWLADERTATGEVRELTLGDGSRLTLNSDRPVDVDLTGPTRRVTLRRGEVFVEVAPAATPFVIVDRDGEARALGTRFAVRRDENDTVVTVTESRVRVGPREAPGGGAEVVAGEELRFDLRGVTRAVGPVSVGALAWQQGRLVFNDAPLTDVLRELRRYRSGLLLADEAALGGLRFTGVLPLRQSDEALALLSGALSLQISRVSPWLVRVGPPSPVRHAAARH